MLFERPEPPELNSAKERVSSCCLPCEVLANHGCGQTLLLVKTTECRPTPSHRIFLYPESRTAIFAFCLHHCIDFHRLPENQTPGLKKAGCRHLEAVAHQPMAERLHWDWDWVTQASPMGHPGVTQGSRLGHARIELSKCFVCNRTEK